MTPQAFIDKWDGKDGSERANYQIFFNDLCALLEVDKPQPSMTWTGHDFVARTPRFAPYKQLSRQINCRDNG